jgi:hypothetical protein
MMKYRIYIDEVGNPDLDSSDNPIHRYLSLTGVIAELEYIQSAVHPQMEELKYRYFRSHPDNPVIFHRKEMVKYLYPFETLRDPSIRDAFDRELLNLLASWEYRVISVCLDKKKHKETYSVWRYDPYHYLLAILLERYVFFLERESAQGDVMAESRGGKEDLRLKDSFRKLVERGTDYILPERFQSSLTSKELKIKQKSNNITGLQIADLIAHPSRNEILKEHGSIDIEIHPFAKRVITILQDKYDKQGERIFGKKFI